MISSTSLFAARRSVLQLAQLLESTRVSSNHELHDPKPKNNGGSALVDGTKISSAEIWRRRERLSRPTIQRDEQLPSKVYYAPEWTGSHRNYDVMLEREKLSPLKDRRTTPDKWEYYNKIVWPKNYVVPETGLPKAREVFYCRESVHYSPKKMWKICCLVRRMNVTEALKQLKYQESKGTLILAEVIEEAMKRAKEEFCIPHPEEMYVAEAFPIQHKIIKGMKRHAHDRYTTHRYRYIHIFVRLEEGVAPAYKGRNHREDGWEKMENYYSYLRGRQFKYSL